MKEAGLKKPKDAKSSDARVGNAVGCLFCVFPNFIPDLESDCDAKFGTHVGEMAAEISEAVLHAFPKLTRVVNLQNVMVC